MTDTLRKWEAKFWTRGWLSLKNFEGIFSNLGDFEVKVSIETEELSESLRVFPHQAKRILLNLSGTSNKEIEEIEESAKNAAELIRMAIIMETQHPLDPFMILEIRTDPGKFSMAVPFFARSGPQEIYLTPSLLDKSIDQISRKRPDGVHLFSESIRLEPKAQFIILYGILTQYLDTQSAIDSYIINNYPREMALEGRGEYAEDRGQTRYTILRNRIMHKRPMGVSASSLKEMEKLTPQLRKIVHSFLKN